MDNLPFNEAIHEGWKLKVLPKHEWGGYVCIAIHEPEVPLRGTLRKGYFVPWGPEVKIYPVEDMRNLLEVLRQQVEEWNKLPHDAPHWVIGGTVAEGPTFGYIRRWPTSDIYENLGRIKRKNDGRWNFFTTIKNWSRFGYAVSTKQGTTKTFAEAQRAVEDLVKAAEPKDVPASL